MLSWLVRNVLEGCFYFGPELAEKSELCINDVGYFTKVICIQNVYWPPPFTLQ